ncbi:MAG: hypothetical protein Q8K58_11570 [Acidimicrobiales bacterium]|nr:hypothetical protein [Acidimicrobiales bacterium]
MSEPIVELLGVYNANGSLRGELSYVLGRLVGRAHCGLCDITHGTLRRRPELDAAVEPLGVPLTLLHLDEVPDDVARLVAESGAPCVLARTAAGLSLLASGAELDACEADPERFVALVRAGAGRLDLTLA